MHERTATIAAHLNRSIMGGTLPTHEIDQLPKKPVADRILVGNVRAPCRNVDAIRIYCGRKNDSWGLAQSPLANPNPLNGEAHRAQNIADYRPYLRNPKNTIVQAEVQRVLEWLRSGQTVELLCWCAPAKACHCDEVRRYLIELWEAR